VKDIVQRSTNYYRKTGDHSFWWGERQLHSVVCPSIAEITGGSFLMERPLKRKPAGEAEYSGNVDYWIYYRDYTLLMEMKHTYFGYERDQKLKIKAITEQLTEARRQLSNIRKEQCGGLRYGGYGVIKIALVTIAFYKGSSGLVTKAGIKDRNFFKLFKSLTDSVERVMEIDIRALWVLNEHLIKRYKIPRDGSEICPALGFVGTISDVQ
jgi:hypothetical protein